MNLKSLLCLFSLLLFVACESPVSTEIKSGDLARTEFAVYTSANKMYDPAWSPDGERIAFISQTPATDIYKMSAAGDTLSPIKRFYKYIISDICAISPDGQYILYSDGNWDSNAKRNNCYLYSTALDTNLLYNEILPVEIYNPQWSLDSRLLYYRTRQNSFPAIGAVTLEGVPVFNVLLDSTTYLYGYSVAPDQQSIVWSGLQGNQRLYQLWLYTPAAGQKQLFASDSINYYSPSWSPDGNSIVYVSKKIHSSFSSLNVYSITNKTSYVLADSISLQANNKIAWSGDGEAIYFIGYLFDNDESGAGIWRVSLTNNSYSFLCPNPKGIILQLNTDASYYVYNSRMLFGIYSFNIADKKLSLLSPETDDELRQLVWSPDGTRIVFSQNNKLYRIPATGGTSAALNIKGINYQMHPDYSPDGSTLVFDNGYEIYTVSANGNKANRINSGSYNLKNPVWSSDGKQIACISRLNNKDSLVVFNYSDGKMIRAKAWPGLYADISWSALHQVLGSYILFTTVSAYNDEEPSYELNALNPENGQILKLFGNGGSFGRFPRTNLYACWAPDAETIAWIQYNGKPDYFYSLNIARVLVDLQ